jgi:hypothetical protein
MSKTEETEEVVEMTEQPTAAEKKAKMSEYNRVYRLTHLDKLRQANKEWRLKNSDKLKLERRTNKEKYAAFQRKYDQTKKDDPVYVEQCRARQARYRENKTAHPENYKQRVKPPPKPRGRPKTRGLGAIKVIAPELDGPPNSPEPERQRFMGRGGRLGAKNRREIKEWKERHASKDEPERDIIDELLDE